MLKIRGPQDVGAVRGRHGHAHINGISRETALSRDTINLSVAARRYNMLD